MEHKIAKSVLGYCYPHGYSQFIFIDQLASLHERFSTAVATYQGVMNSYALQRQQQQYQQGYGGQPQYPQQQYHYPAQNQHF